MFIKIFNNNIKFCYVERLNNYNNYNFYYNLHLGNYNEVVDYLLNKKTISYYDALNNLKHIKLQYYNLTYYDKNFVYG
jgi:hypothetical protein